MVRSSTLSGMVTMNGRRAQAARNDATIIEAAREVFLADPGAPIAAVAQRAKVGIGALYRRYRSKEELLQHLSLDAMRRYADLAEQALTEDGDPWDTFAAFMRDAMEAGAGSLTSRLAGTFTVTDEMRAAAQRGYRATRRLLDKAQAAGAMRADVEVGDVSVLLELVQSLDMGDFDRTRELRNRYLQMMLESLHMSDHPPLPGPAPSWEEIGRRYDRK